MRLSPLWISLVALGVALASLAVTVVNGNSLAVEKNAMYMKALNSALATHPGVTVAPRTLGCSISASDTEFLLKKIAEAQPGDTIDAPVGAKLGEC